MTTPDEGRLRRLLAHVPPTGTDAIGDCLDENALTGYVEGRLPEEIRERIEAHWVVCPACRAELIERAAPEPTVEAPARTPVRRAVLSIAIAAILLAAIGVGLWLAGRRTEGVPDLDALVAQATGRLAARGARFQGLGTFDWDGLPAVAVERGGIEMQGAIGLLLETRPALAWRPVPGASTYDLVVRSDLGTQVLVWQGDGTSVPWPAGRAGLEPGRYAWKVETTGPVGRRSGRRTFEIPSDEARAAFREAVDVVRAEASSQVADLLVAELAAREGYLLVAHEAARRYAAAHPGAARGQRALEALAAATGLPAE